MQPQQTIIMPAPLLLALPCVFPRPAARSQTAPLNKALYTPYTSQ